jgi:hypothetical protein
MLGGSGFPSHQTVRDFGAQSRSRPRLAPREHLCAAPVFGPVRLAFSSAARQISRLAAGASISSEPFGEPS